MNSQTPDVVASPVTHLPNPEEYALTIGEASNVMRLERCKFASPRKVQRLCREGHLDCQKITTSRNGQPIVEWLINEASLRKRIDEMELKIVDGDALASPDSLGNAREDLASGDVQRISANDLATPDKGGVANSFDEVAINEGNNNDVMASPDDDGDATFVEPSKAMLMIENARLTAELTGKSEFIDQVLDDKSFLREELRDARERGRDVTKIAERMLETLETMAMGGKLQRLPEQQASEFPVSPEPRQSGDIQEDKSERFRI